MNRRAAGLALLSAALFGASTPAAKALLGTVDPALLAGLFYCGAGIGTGILRRMLRSLRSNGTAQETPLARGDVPWLAGAIASGGVVGPLLLMFGLAHTEASTASLLLTLEGAATALLAWFVFHENFDRRIALGMLLLIAGALLLSWSGTATLATVTGPAAIVAACVAWGLDNNLTRKVSLADPLQIVAIKGLVAGPVNLVLALAVGGHWPTFGITLTAAIVGFIGYGVSLALYVLALRDLGTARTGAYFATAPFLGAVVALAFLHEPVTLQLVIAGALMAAGVYLHLTEHHEHEHAHEPMTHSHLHLHDEHHRHAHELGDPPGEPHTHVHRHAPLRHSHPHVPDMHHTHRH